MMAQVGIEIVRDCCAFIMLVIINIVGSTTGQPVTAGFLCGKWLLNFHYIKSHCMR